MEQSSSDDGLYEIRSCSVEVLNHALIAWEVHTRKNKTDLARESKIWSVHLESRGVFRTRNLDSYLNLRKLPRNPKWSKVLQTILFVLSQIPADHPDSISLSTSYQHFSALLHQRLHLLEFKTSKNRPH